MKHTPTPWKHKETEMHRHIITGKVSDGSEEIAEVNDLWVNPGTMKANAEFICKAVNNHDKLLSALKLMVKACIVAKHPEDRGVFFKIQEQARDAIKSAEEQS